jgi:hypothetical protein
MVRIARRLVKILQDHHHRPPIPLIQLRHQLQDLQLVRYI